MLRTYPLVSLKSSDKMYPLTIIVYLNSQIILNKGINASLKLVAYLFIDFIV